MLHSRHSLYMRKYAFATFIFCLLTLSSNAFSKNEIHPPFISIKKGQTTIYLLGDIHYGTKDLPPLPEPIEHAFSHADVFLIESEQPFHPKYFPTEVEDIGLYSEYLSHQDFLDLQRILASVGITLRQDSQGSFSASTLLVRRIAIEEHGFHLRDSPGLYLMRRALTEKKSVDYMETSQQYYDLMTGPLYGKMTRQQCVDGLKAALEEYRSGRAWREFDGMYQAWAKGDVEQISATSHNNQERTGQSTGDRGSKMNDQDWMDQLIQLMNIEFVDRINKLLKKPGIYFAAVGAQHIPGVVSMLKEEGVEVESGY